MSLAQKLGIQVVNKDFFYSCFGEAVLPIQSDELTSYALELWERHWSCGQLNGLLDIGDDDFTTSFARVVFLVNHYLCEDVRSRLVKLVEVVLLGRWFLLHVRRN